MLEQGIPQCDRSCNITSVPLMIPCQRHTTPWLLPKHTYIYEIMRILARVKTRGREAALCKTCFFLTDDRWLMGLKDDSNIVCISGSSRVKPADIIHSPKAGACRWPYSLTDSRGSRQTCIRTSAECLALGAGELNGRGFELYLCVNLGPIHHLRTGHLCI